MAFPTLQQIASLQRPTGLQNLGNLLSSGYQAYQQADERSQAKKAAQAGAQKEANAANFIKQAVAEQDPQKSERFILQAFEESPETVDKFFTMQGKRGTANKLGIEREKLDIRKEEARLRALERADRKETNELKRQELGQKIELQKEKVSQAKAESQTMEEKKESSILMAQEAESLAREIAEADNLGDITGTITPKFAAIRPESQDLINKAERLQSLLTVDNLKLMSGVLTDRDIKFLTNVASGLNLDEGGIKGSTSAVKARLLDISNKIKGGISGKAKKDPASNIVEWGSM